MKPIFGEPLKDREYQLRKGAYAIIFNSTQDRVLTVNTGKGEHFLPGGGIEGDESNEYCIEREMLEETGFSVIVGSLIGSAQCYFVSRNKEFILSDGYFYLAEIQTKIQEPSDVDHHAEWIDLEDLEKLLVFSHQIWAVRKALEL